MNNIKLGSVQKEHSKEIFDLIEKNRSFLKKWLPWVDATTKIQHTELFINKANHYANRQKGLFCSVFHNGNIVGVVGAIRKGNNPSEMFLNYWIGENYKNQGIATNAIKRIILYLKENWETSVFYIKSDKNNKASNRIANKLGFYQIPSKSDNENVFLWKVK